MLLKLTLHESSGLLRTGTDSSTGGLGSTGEEGVVCNWIVNENLPFGHPCQVDSLVKALGLNPRNPKDTESIEKLDLKTHLEVVLDGTVLDLELSLVEQKVKSGSSVSIRRIVPRMRGVTSTKAPSPHSISREQSSYVHSEGQPSTVYSDSGRPNGDPFGEQYDAAGFGWFPFIGIPEGERVRMAFCNPDVEPVADDLRPNVTELCDRCSEFVLAGDGVNIPIDQHYKPMMMQTCVVEGKVEKLSGSKITRWVDRYLCISEKSIDWYDEEPKPSAVRVKTRGTRMLYEGSTVLLKQVIEHPAAPKYPKCKDPKFSYFGAVLIDPGHPEKKEVTLLFRASSMELKGRFVSFLKAVLSRAQKSGARRDPVYWKQRADGLLTSLSALYGCGCDLKDREQALLREVTSMEKELEQIRDEKPNVRESTEEHQLAIEVHRNTIDALLREKQEADDEVKEAQDKLKQTKEQYDVAKAAIGEELSAQTIRWETFKAQRKKLLKEIASANEDVENFERSQHETFKRWRKTEERYKAESKSPHPSGKGLSFCLSPNIQVRPYHESNTPPITPRRYGTTPQHHAGTAPLDCVLVEPKVLALLTPRKIDSDEI